MLIPKIKLFNLSYLRSIFFDIRGILRHYIVLPVGKDVTMLPFLSPTPYKCSYALFIVELSGEREREKVNLKDVRLCNELPTI